MTEEVKTKRVYELEVGDVFKHLGIYYIVYRIKDGLLWYKLRSKATDSYKLSFGCKCKMKVELVEPSKLIRPEATYNNSSRLYEY